MQRLGAPGSIIISLDWHQVLDDVRFNNKETFRPRGYYLVPVILQKLAEIKAASPNCVILITSYCHCAEYRTSVLQVPDQILDHRIVTDKRIGRLGKLAALLSICKEGSRVVHVDDSGEICKEISEYRGGHFSISAKGIAIPRRNRNRPQERYQHCPYHRSVIHALDSVIQELWYHRLGDS